MTGRNLGNYFVIEKLGEGGMGVVYKAEDRRTGKRVVLKVLRADALEDPDRRRRFSQEACAASALNSPNIVAVYEVARDGGIDFIAMEYVSGQPLDFLIPTGGMPPDQVVRYGTQICDALSVAHAAGIIHRDLKPGNIMITRDGRVKLLDFGLAKLTSGWTGAEVTGPRTAEGSIIGTVSYMSPEQALARPLDARSDLFSLGAVLYEMAVGRRAFGNASSLIALTAVLRDTPIVPETLPAPLASAILRCLEKDPDQRFRDAASVRDALSSITVEPQAPGDPCLEGERALRNLSPASLRKARSCFEQAIQAGDTSDRVYAGICEYYSLTSLLGLGEPAEVLPKAIWAGKKALQIESVSVTLALLRANHEGKWTEFGRFLEGSEDRKRVALWYWRPLGEWQQALAGVASDPSLSAWIALESGDLAAAEHFATEAELDCWIGCWVRAWALIASGRHRQAAEACHSGLAIEPGNPHLESALATAYVYQKQTEAALRLLNQPHWRPASFGIPVLAALGEFARAEAAVADARRRRDPWLVTALRLPNVRQVFSEMGVA